jgi:hypothetical protein
MTDRLPTATVRDFRLMSGAAVAREAVVFDAEAARVFDAVFLELAFLVAMNRLLVG